jgi:predicted O-methyltransferase YrrM
MPRRRWDILIDLLKDRPHEIGAEIGVFRGDTTIRLLAGLPNLKKYIAVDPFEHYPEFDAITNPKGSLCHNAPFPEIEKEFFYRVAEWKKNVDVIPMRAFSTDAAKRVPDEYLDFVFIDANHAYSYVLDDIKAWLPKVKKGGLVSGHDYNVTGYKGSFQVKKAVKEIFGTHYAFERHVWYVTK